MRFMSEEQRIARCREFLESVTALKGASSEDELGSEPEIPDASLNLLIKSALEPGLPLLAMYQALDLHPAEGRAALDDLLARGLVRSHRLVRQGRGGQPIVLEVLAPGIEVLRQRGITPTSRLIARGGFKHDCYARWLRQWASQKRYGHWFERTLANKAFDLVYQDEQGDLHAIEIALSGSGKWNAQQALKAGSVAGVKDVVIACEDREMLKQIENEVGKIDELGLYREKILYKPLADYWPW